MYRDNDMYLATYLQLIYLKVTLDLNHAPQVFNIATGGKC